MTLFICTAGASVAGPFRAGRDEAALDTDIAAKERKSRDDARGDRAAFLSALSAETNALNRAKCGEGDIVEILTTDTRDGFHCGRRLAGFVEREFGCAANPERVAGLQVDDSRKFARAGAPNLFEAIDKARRAHRDQEDVRLHISGGFKGVAPFTALYGLIENLPIEYIFEQGPDLIRLAPLPIAFDWERLGPIMRLVEAIKAEIGIARERFEAQMAACLPDAADWTEAFFERDGDQVTLSGLGLIALGRIEAARVAPFVRIGPKAKAALDGAGPEARAKVDKLLSIMGDRVAREAGQHRDFCKTTDLNICKLGGTHRGAYWLDANIAHVCELFSDHGSYDFWWKKSKRIDRADYETAAFERMDVQPFEPGAGDEGEDESTADPHEALRRENARLRDELKRCREQRDQFRAEAKSWRQVVQETPRRKPKEKGGALGEALKAAGINAAPQGDGT